MRPIENKNDFDDVNPEDLEETQRQITLRIKKIKGDENEQVRALKEELSYWTKEVLYRKAQFLCNKVDKLKNKIDMAIDILKT